MSIFSRFLITENKRLKKEISDLKHKNKNLEKICLTREKTINIQNETIEILKETVKDYSENYEKRMDEVDSLKSSYEDKIKELYLLSDDYKKEFHNQIQILYKQGKILKNR